MSFLAIYFITNAYKNQKQLQLLINTFQLISLSETCGFVDFHENL